MIQSLPKRASSVKRTDETKKCSAFRAIDLREDILGAHYKCILSAINHKLNVSGHILIRTFFLVLVCATRGQSLSAPFSYTLYIIHDASSR
jgi:hypothetical protein